MLYRIGTADEIKSIKSRFPESVIAEVLAGTSIRDNEYGHDRDYTKTGGYSILIETKEDIQKLKAIVDYEIHPCEWATRIGGTGFICALYIMNNDFTIDVFMPLSIAPKAIINDLED